MNIIDTFGNTIIPGELVGFHKTVAKNKVLIYGKYESSDGNKIKVIVYGYNGNPEIKDKIKTFYEIKNNSKFYKMQVKKR